MTGSQGKIVVAATVVVLTGLLFRHALTASNWSGFWVSEVQLLVPMAISWWVLARD